MARTVETIKLEQKAILKKQTEILDKVQKEKRNLTKEEEREYAALDADFADCEDEARYLARNPNVASWLSSSRKPPIKPTPPGGNLTQDQFQQMMAGSQSKGATKPMPDYRYNPESREQRDLLNQYFLHGTPAFTPDEFRALSSDIDTAGGYLVLPVSMANEFNKAKDNYVVMRKLARQFKLENATSLGVPSLSRRMASPTWTAELATGTEDSTMQLDGRSLSPHPLAKRIKVSEKLMRVASLSPEVIVRDEFAYVFGITEDNCFLNGTGANQPLGVMTQSKNGIDTDRDYTTEVTATVKADDLLEVIGNQKQQYRAGSCWIMSRALETKIRKLKDGEGNTLWQVGLAAGIPNQLCGYPVYVSEYMPSTFTSGAYVAIFGDFSYYWIADALPLRIQRLSELYAAEGNIGFIARAEVDAMPVISEAFTRIKLK
jgi:HK97 family phage major capsid protein